MTNEQASREYADEHECEKITGFKTVAEFAAYEKGYDNAQNLMMQFIEKWDGSDNSQLGHALKKVINAGIEQERNRDRWIAVTERLPEDKDCEYETLEFNGKGWHRDISLWIGRSGKWWNQDSPRGNPQIKYYKPLSNDLPPLPSPLQTKQP